MLSFTSWIRLVRNTTWLDPNLNNESIDHLRSNQGRSQDFSRSEVCTFFCFLLPPPPTTTTTPKTQIFLIPWLKMRLRCKPNRFFLYMKWRLLNSLSPYWVHWLKVLKLVSPIFVCKWLIFFYHFLPFCFCQYVDVMVSDTSITAKTGRACYLRDIFPPFLYIYHSWVGPKMKHSFVLENIFNR